MVSFRSWFAGKEKSAPREKRVARSSSLSTPMTLKDTAEFYFQALDNGLVEVAEVIAWADNIILQEESPDLSIIEVSMSGSKGKYEVMRALLDIAGDADLELVPRKIFLSMAEKLSRESDFLPRVIRYLYWKIRDGEITDEELETQIYKLDEELEYSASRPMDCHKIAPEISELLINYARPD